MFCFRPADYDKVFSVKSEINKLVKPYSFDKIEGCKNWIELLEKKRHLIKQSLRRLNQMLNPTP